MKSALAGGTAREPSDEDLDRHDSVLYMAVTRARQALGPDREWLENEHGSYRLVGVECRVLSFRDQLQGFDPRPVLAAASGRPPALESEPVPAPESTTATLAYVRANGHATTGRLAKALHVSEMTALRELKLRDVERS